MYNVLINYILGLSKNHHSLIAFKLFYAVGTPVANSL